MLDSISSAMNWIDFSSTQQQWEVLSEKDLTGNGQIPSLSTKNTHMLFQSSVDSSSAMPTSTDSNVNDWKPQLFPFKMYDLLEDAAEQAFEDVISWTCNGTAFKIHNRRAFEKKIMPTYFPNMNSYKSFRRQLNFYGIYQDKNIQDRPDNAYSHEFFVRGQRYLCEFMERRKQGLRQFSKAANGPKPMESTSSSEPISSTQGLCMSSMFPVDAPMSNAVLDTNFTQSVSLMAPSSAQTLSPDPIATSASREQRATHNIYQAFMNQEWEGLPMDTTPRDVVSEIIATFRTA